MDIEIVITIKDVNNFEIDNQKSLQTKLKEETYKYLKDEKLKFKNIIGKITLSESGFPEKYKMIPTWNSKTIYKGGSLVKYEGKIFQRYPLWPGEVDDNSPPPVLGHWYELPFKL